MFKPLSLSLLLSIPAAAQADNLRVVVNLAPLHSLTAQVMGDRGTPELLTKPGTSAHGHALRPSEAQRLQEADMVVWLGAAMSPWLDEALKEMSSQAVSLPLLEAEGLTLLTQRGAHNHDHGDDHDEEHHDDHDKHESEEHAHQEGHEDHDEDEAPRVDTHAWLNPDNAVIWLSTIAEGLAAQDPANAEAYRANAAAAAKAIAEQATKTEARLAPLADHEFLTAHDAYQYYEARFGLTSHAAITDSDDQDAGPAHLREVLSDSPDMGCFVTEPGTSAATIALVTETLDIPHVKIDPLGADLPVGADHYGALMSSLADGFAECLGKH